MSSNKHPFKLILTNNINFQQKHVKKEILCDLLVTLNERAFQNQKFFLQLNYKHTQTHRTQNTKAMTNNNILSFPSKLNSCKQQMTKY